VVIDLDEIIEPMIADPDVNNDDVSKRYTHDVIRPVCKAVDLGFVGSCMVHKGDMQIMAQMFRNLEEKNGTVEFKVPFSNLTTLIQKVWHEQSTTTYFI